MCVCVFNFKNAANRNKKILNNNNKRNKYSLIQRLHIINVYVYILVEKKSPRFFLNCKLI
jgi:hypothetical protein